MSITKGQRAYEMRRDTQASWREVNKAVQCYSEREARKQARKWAFLNGHPWPIDVGGHQRGPKAGFDHWHHDTMGERAYLTRKQTGLPFSVIGKELGCNNSAEALALRYAMTRNLPWPLPSETDMLVEQMGLTIYRLRCSGISWAKMSRQFDMSKDRVKKIAQLYAERHHLKPPKPIPAGERAYRARAEKKFPWKKVARYIGYKHAAHACRAAQEYADREDLPWPIPI